MILDQHIAQQLTEQHENWLVSGKLSSQTKLTGYYDTFRRHFGLEVLRNLDGEALLATMHNHGNHDSLVYWLEFKNDDEFPTFDFGSIGGGSALKFGIYRSKDTGAWMTGHPKKQRAISVDEAIAIARRHRDQLLAGAELLDKLPPMASDADYARLQQELRRVAPDVADMAWGHKYLTLLYPDKLDDYHVENFQRFHLIKLLQVPPAGDGRYVCAGQFVAIAAGVGMPLNHLTKLLNDLHGDPYRYWRCGTRLTQWPLMRNGNWIGIGWPELGNLSGTENSREGKDQIRQLVTKHYPAAPQAVGRIIQQVFNFIAAVGKGDYVLAADSATILGIGKVTGPYSYEPGSDLPHRRPVEWLSLEEWQGPRPEELRTALHEVKNYYNLVEVERRVRYPIVTQTVQPGVAPEPWISVPRVPIFPGVAGRVQAVLDRKRQVILYGPPGTGKTYWAQKVARDLAAYAAFGLPFTELNETQCGTVSAQGANTATLVRTCTFHPAYGYEDFLEGYRPVLVNDQLAFERRDGIFKRLCDDARRQPDQRFYLVIDEINRGDIPRIFGELLTILERDKRGETVLLPLSGDAFSVPDNVYVIGTMNTADRSIALLDTALRRRFGFVELMPDISVLGKTVIEGIPLGQWLDALNRRICEHVGRDARNLQIGHAYLLDSGHPLADLADFARVLQDDIVPLLEEYCYEDYGALERILGSGLVDVSNQRIRHELFEPARQLEMRSALLEPAPEIATSFVATSAEEGFDEGIEGAEDEEDGSSAGSSTAHAQ